MPSSNSTAFLQRFNEVAAVSCAEMQLRTLGTMVKSPATKAYQRARAARRELWLELARHAQAQADALSGEAKALAKKPAPRIVAKPGIAGSSPIHQDPPSTVVAEAT